MPGEGVALTGRGSAAQRHRPKRERGCAAPKAEDEATARWLWCGFDGCGADSAEWSNRGSRRELWTERRENQLGAGDADQTAGRKLARFGRAWQVEGRKDLFSAA